MNIPSFIHLERVSEGQEGSRLFVTLSVASVSVFVLALVTLVGVAIFLTHNGDSPGL